MDTELEKYLAILARKLEAWAAAADTLGGNAELFAPALTRESDRLDWAIRDARERCNQAAE